MTVEIKPAATLALLRDGAQGPELLMVERARSMGFAAGAWVFPGGKVDATDVALATDPIFAGIDPEDAAARVAAVRETFEEVGVLLTEGPALDGDLRAAWRKRLVGHGGSFADFLAATGHRLSAAAVTPFARWCPPARLERARFDTRFYVARMPEGETAAHDGLESLSSHWTRPADAVARADGGTAHIIFPTRMNLLWLGAHDTIDDLVAAAEATPVHLVEPWIEDREGEPHLCVRDDCGYPVTSQPVRLALRG